MKLWQDHKQDVQPAGVATMESGREYNAREDIEAEVRILVLVQLFIMAPYFKRRMLQQRHTEYIGINESPGQDSAYRVIVGLPLQRLKRRSNECGFDSHRSHKSDMPGSGVKICLRVRSYLMLQYPIQNRSVSTT